MKMKQIILKSFFLVFIAGMSLSSCKKDSTGSTDITGTWTAGTITLNITVGDMTLTQYLVDVAGYTQELANSYAAIVEQSVKQEVSGTIEIKSDNTYTATFGGGSDSGTWSLNADKTMLTITPTGSDPITFDVIEISSSKLHVQGIETMPLDLNQDGTDEILNVNVDITFTR